MEYKVIPESQENGGYTVYVPTLLGCVSQGDSAEEAMLNIKEAIQLYRESIRECGLPFPQIKERKVAV